MMSKAWEIFDAMPAEVRRKINESEHWLSIMRIKQKYDACKDWNRALKEHEDEVACMRRS